MCNQVWDAESGDLVFTCPPYWCLEKYSDDPEDLSNMSLDDFTRAHAAIIGRCAGALKQDRFAVWVIGDCRDPKTGRWVRLPDRTKEAFAQAGMHLHAEIVFATPIGSKRMCGQAGHGSQAHDPIPA